MQFEFVAPLDLSIFAARIGDGCDVAALRKQARVQLAGPRDAMAGARNGRTREVIATYVDRITICPMEKRGEMLLNPAAASLWKQHDRPKRRSWANRIEVAGHG